MPMTAGLRDDQGYDLVTDVLLVAFGRGMTAVLMGEIKTVVFPMQKRRLYRGSTVMSGGANQCLVPVSRFAEVERMTWAGLLGK